MIYITHIFYFCYAEVMSPLKAGRPEIGQLPAPGPATGGAADSHVAAGQRAGECSNLQDEGTVIFCAVTEKELAAPPASAVAVAPTGVPVPTSLAAVAGIPPPAPPAPPAVVPGPTTAGNTSENPSQNRAPVVIAAASGPPGHSASLAVGETPLERVAMEEAVASPDDGRRRGQRKKMATQGMDDFVVETVQQPKRGTGKPSRQVVLGMPQFLTLIYFAVLLATVGFAKSPLLNGFFIIYAGVPRLR